MMKNENDKGVWLGRVYSHAQKILANRKDFLIPSKACTFGDAYVYANKACKKKLMKMSVNILADIFLGLLYITVGIIAFFMTSLPLISIAVATIGFLYMIQSVALFNAEIRATYYEWLYSEAEMSRELDIETNKILSRNEDLSNLSYYEYFNVVISLSDGARLESIKNAFNLDDVD